MRLPGLFAVLLIFSFLPTVSLYAQRELVPADDPVYKFLLRQEVDGTLIGFHWGMLPLSRKEIAGFLDSLENSTGLSLTDQGILRDLQVRFSFDRSRTLSRSASLLGGGARSSI